MKHPETKIYFNRVYNAVVQGLDYLRIIHMLRKSKIFIIDRIVKLLVYKICEFLDLKMLDSYNVQIKNAKENTRVIKRIDVCRYLLSRKIRSVKKCKIFETDAMIVLSYYPVLSKLNDIWSSFKNAFDKKSPELIDEFIKHNINSEFESIRRFTKGINRDIIPVKNGILFQTTSGFVEGNNALLKNIKRSCGARTSLDVLFKRMYGRKMITQNYKEKKEEMIK